MTAPRGAVDHRRVATVLRREWGSVTSLLAELPPPGWRRPTRCAGWTVEDLARHAVWGVSMELDALRRARAGRQEPAVGRTMAPDCEPAELITALRSAASDLATEVDLLGEGTATMVCPMPFGGAPLPLALDVFVFEAGIHASDFADAAGEDRPLANDVVPATTRVLHGFLPVFAEAGTGRPPTGTTFSLQGGDVVLAGRWTDSGLVMGDAVPHPTVTVIGDDSTVLLFATGRLALDDPRVQIMGTRRWAEEFKVHVPGP